VAIEKLFAGAVLLLCGLMLLRLLLGARRRARVDAALRRAALRLKLAGYRAWHWRGARRDARRMADEAIRRARGASQVERDGNVIRPKSFRRDGSNDSRKLH
jgi:hypothetical protein